MATDNLKFRIDIPGYVSGRIDRDCGDDEEQRRDQHVHYYITCSPYALMEWSHIAGQLHFWGEETAERAAKDYVQRAPGTCGCGMHMCIYWNVYMTQQIHACSDVHCVCSSAFVDYTDAHTDHICAHVHLHTY